MLLSGGPPHYGKLRPVVLHPPAFANLRYNSSAFSSPAKVEARFMRSMRKIWAVVGSLAMLTGQMAIADPQQAGDALVPSPTLRVTTRLVLVDVVVTDKQGKPVTGLKREDFAVQENGKAQKVSTFVPPAQNLPPAPAALPPGVYSNKPQYRSPGGPIAVLLLDAANTQFKDQAYARLQMLKFVRKRFKPGQHMAVMTLTDSLHVLQDFTTDPQLLTNALDHFLPLQQRFAGSEQATTLPIGAGTPTPGSAVAAMDASAAPGHPIGLGLEGPRGGAGAAAIVAVVTGGLQDFVDAQTGYNLERRTDITFEALDALARALGGLPGRKNVIWVTGDLPFTLNPENRTVTQAELEENLPGQNRRVWAHSAGNYAASARGSYADQIRDADARLSAAQIAIYPVDARGLSIALNQDAQEVMREMARDTGGRAYVNQNEINYGVERALEDTSASYTLGYYTENKKWDGKFRAIKVKLDRPGTELQYRRGYFAVDPAQVKGYTGNNEVAAALNGAVPATQVAFSARIVPPANAKGKISLDFLVDAGTVSAVDVSGGKKVNVIFYATAFSGNGKMLGNQSEKVDRTVDANTYQQLMQHGMLLHMDLVPPPGATQLRLAVQDVPTGLVGSLNAPLKTE
jgi:VWFA-related protein